jgi:ABC-type uncharacterized transport system substrate-binding protein
MQRRDFIRFVGASAVTLPLAAHAQQSPRVGVRRIGIMMPYAATDAEYQMQVAAFRDELRNRGWLEGRNIQFDVRWTTDNMDWVRSNATDLVALKPDVMLAIGGRVVPILMQLTKTIPIVVPGAADPVGVGWVQSIARPGGNVTGFTFLELSIFGKMLELLKQVQPKIARALMVYNPDNPSTGAFRRSFEAAASELALTPMAIPIHQMSDIDQTVKNVDDPRRTAVLIPPDITLTALRRQLVDLIAKSRMPAIYPQAVYVRDGGLMFYGIDRIDLWRRAAEYVDRILHGESPADLPFQQPTKYELIVNLNAARALDLQIPQNLLATADEVIE